MMLMTLLERLVGLHRLTVTENHRVIVLYKGQIERILSPGEHRLPLRKRELEWHDIRGNVFTSDYETALTRTRPDLVEQHLDVLTAGEAEVVAVSRANQIEHVTTQGRQTLIWRDAGPWTVDRWDTETEPTRQVALRLIRAGHGSLIKVAHVAEGTVEVLYVDGALDRVLTAGTHYLWTLDRTLTTKIVDTRQRTHEVVGQEILTRDRVTIRVNPTADYRVTDPVKAVTTVADYREALHLAVQYAMRKSLGALTLDAMLADKASVDAEATEAVRAEMATHGIEVRDIAVKDVILPGEMREILNRVVEAQKEAEANVIRRREETNATRSLLNTAKVMAENPVMLRLKELEALETIADKVDQLTVHNGTKGLLSDIVSLSD